MLNILGFKNSNFKDINQKIEELGREIIDLTTSDLSLDNSLTLYEGFFYNFCIYLKYLLIIHAGLKF